MVGFGASLMRWRVPLAVALTLLGLVWLGGAGHDWPFTAAPPLLSPTEGDPSPWQYFLADRTTLGFVRLLIVALALYATASVVALVLTGRWIKTFGTSGLTADDAAATNETLDKLKAELKATAADLEEVSHERDELRTILEELVP